MSFSLKLALFLSPRDEAIVPVRSSDSPLHRTVYQVSVAKGDGLSVLIRAHRCDAHAHRVVQYIDMDTAEAALTDYGFSLASGWLPVEEDEHATE